jgi:small subunit ribosomal protein S17
MEKKTKVKIGHVLSNKMDKTVVVAIDVLKKHPIYKKSFKRTVKYKAHDKKNTCNIGDTVKIMEIRPLSKEKRWRVVEVLAESKPDEVKE